MLHDYNIEINNSNKLKNNTMLNYSMELSLLNNLLRENLIIEVEQQEIMKKRRETCCDAGIKEGYFNTKYAFSNSIECAF